MIFYATDILGTIIKSPLSVCNTELFYIVLKADINIALDVMNTETN